MKPRAFCFARVLGAVLVLLFAEFAGAQIFVTANTNWSAISSGSGPAGQPSGTDAIIVKNGATLTVDVSNGQCASLDLGQDGVDAGDGTLLFTAGSLVECGGDVIVGTTAPDHAGTVTMAAGGTLTISGALLLTAGQSTFTAGNGTVAFNGSAAQTIAATTYHHLTYSGTATATLAGPAIVTGDLTIASGTLASGNQALTVSGNWINHGSFTPGTATVTFTGTGTVNVTGSSTTAFNNVTVNLGSSASVLEVLAPITLANNGLTLTQGTFKLSSASTITPFSGSETIPAGAGFHLNHASAASNWGSSGSLTLNGKLIVDHGSMNIGSSSGNQLTVSGASSEVTLNGGTLTLAGRISVTSSGGGNGLTVSGGEMVVTSVGNNSSSAPNFNLGATGKFTMTGGMVTCERANSNASGAELVIASGSGAKSITGGTFRLGNASTPAAQTIEINSAVPIFHFTVNSANATAQLVNTPLTINGDLLISAGTLDANNLNLELAGNWTNNGSFVPGTGTVTMNGTSPQTMSGSTFYNLTINNANGVSLLTDENVSNTLSLLNGNVTTGTNKMIITAGGAVARTSGHIAGNLQKNFAAGSTVVQTFEVGTGSDYTPVEVTLAQVNNAGNVTAQATSGDHASIGTSTLDASKSVNRNWTLTQDAGLGFTTYEATFHFVASDLDGGANTSNLIVGKLDAATWTYPTVGTRTATSTQAAGMTSFSDFQLAECALPSVSFSSVGPYCVNDAAVDLTAFVSPSGGTFSGNGVTSAGLFTPSDAGTGTHTITYTFTSGDNCTNSASQNIVVNPLPSVTFSAVTAVCANAVAIDLASYVSPSGGTFSGTGVTSAGIFTPSDAGVGTHTITYTFTSGDNCTNSASQNIVVNPLPSVTFSAVTAVCANAAALDLTSYVLPSGGTFSGNGVTSAGVFTPSDAGAGTHTITYSFADGNSCTNTASQNIIVNPLPAVTFDPVGPYCVNSPAVDLTSFVSPAGGTFSGNGVTSAGLFTPSDAGVGTHTITYSFTDGNNCTNSASQNITVETLPTVTFNPAGPYCVNAAAVDLTAFVSPSGGTFSGTGVTSAGIFTPSDAGVGTHTITYTFTSGDNCTNSASQNIVVNPLPSVTFNAVGAVCVNAAALDLTSYVLPSGGTFSGNGVTSAGVFTPSDAGAGTHTITYSFTDGNSCTNTASQNIIVNPLPAVTFDPVGPFLVTDAPADFSSAVSPAGGSFAGPGISGTMFDPSVAGVGTHTVTYSFTDGNSCTNSASQNITVNPAAPPPDHAFVLLANKITLQQTKQATPSDRIHSNGALTIEKGSPSTYNSDLTAIGKITIYRHNLINGNVTSPLPVANAGVINGTLTLGPVDFEALPSLSYSAGGPSHFVPSNGTLTLLPGSYHHVVLNSFSTLKLSSGDYFFTSLRYNGSTTTTAVLEIDLSSGEPITLNVVSNLYLGHEVAMRLLPNGEGDSELVTINTRQSSLSLGREAYLLGTFNAPHANVTLLKNSQLRGSICANELIVARDCLFLHHDSPGSLPGPGNLPKPSGEAVSSEQLSVTSYQLEQNYPNPFNPSTVISFQLPAAGEVNLSIFNTNGQLVKQVARGNFASGRHTLVWDATDAHGERVASGVYLYVIKVGEFTAQRKLVLIQ